jgi:hypothetical protein
MSQPEGTPYKRHIQIGCAVFVVVLALGSYFSWVRMRRLYNFRVPPEARVYRIEPGEGVGDVRVEFWYEPADEHKAVEEVLALNPGDGKPMIEQNKAWRQDSDKIVRVNFVTDGNYTLQIVKQKR